MKHRFVSTRKIETLLAEGRSDPAKEEELLKALLDANLYAHVPKTAPPAGRMQFVQFRRPDNEQFVLPIFSSKEKAVFAAAGNVAVISMRGRRLLALTQGATLMIDPNDDGLTLYPAEIAALLSGRPLASTVRTEILPHNVPVRMGPPAEQPTLLISLLKAIFERDNDVVAAYLTEVHRGETFEEAMLLVTVVVDVHRAEHIARECGQHLLEEYSGAMSVAFRFHPPGIPLPPSCVDAAQIFDRAQKQTN